MGDRVIMQVVDNEDNFGPILYGHWIGGDAKEILKAIKCRMASRVGDLEYTTARLVQEMIRFSGENDNTGIGIWNADRIQNVVDSHGDAGVILLNCNTFQAQAGGGYYSEEMSPFDYE